MSIQMLPLNKLQLSANNVRKSGAEDNLSELVANIEARGVLQNLIGGPAKRKGFYDIFAGGRRLRALNVLASAGKLPKTHPVPVLVVDASAEEVSETSLAENFIRLQMTPTDECKAFLHFLGKDGDVEAVARRFGQTRKFVEGRLRLANLAPAIFQLLEEGQIGMEIAKAYAATDDQARQLNVFERMKNTWMAREPAQIRRLMLEDTMKASDPIALLVGRERYEAAGGRVEEDLFSDNQTAIWTDGDIARRLAGELMEEAAAKVAEETGFGSIVPVAASNTTWNARDGLVEADLEEPELTEEQEQRLNAIEARLDVIEAEFEGEELDEASADRLEAEAQQLKNEADGIGQAIVPDERKGELTRFLVIGADGQPRLEEGYYERPKDRDTGESTSGGVGDAGPGGGTSGFTSTYVDPKAVAAKEQGLSGRLIDELAIQRRDILALHVGNNPQLALDLAIYSMACRRLGSCYDLGVSIAVNERHDPIQGEQRPKTQASEAMIALRESLDRDWAKLASHRERFEAFQALSDEQRAGWLAVCAADSLSASIGVPRAARHMPFLDAIGQQLDIDVAGWWRPTAENYFGRIKKAKILDILFEIGGQALRDRYSSCKHGELADAAEKVCAGTAIMESAVREKAIAWVPDAMRFDLGSGCADRDGAYEDGDDELLDGEGGAGDDLEGDAGAGGPTDGTEASPDNGPDTVDTLDPHDNELMSDGEHLIDLGGCEELDAA